MKTLILCPDDASHQEFKVVDARVDRNGVSTNNPEHQVKYVCETCGEQALMFELPDQPREKYVLDVTRYTGQDENTETIIPNAFDATVQGFWQCECDDQYVHRTDVDPYCWRCGTQHDSSPDAKLHAVYHELDLTDQEILALAMAQIEAYEKTH